MAPLACVDSDGLFTFVDIGLPGRFGNAAAYNNSQLKFHIDHGKMAQCSIVAMVRPCLAGHSVFGLSPTMMKIYPDDGNLPHVRRRGGNTTKHRLAFQEITSPTLHSLESVSVLQCHLELFTTHTNIEY
eukprot:scpid104292/ scgid22763/ 